MQCNKGNVSIFTAIKYPLQFFFYSFSHQSSRHISSRIFSPRLMWGFIIFVFDHFVETFCYASYHVMPVEKSDFQCEFCFYRFFSIYNCIWNGLQFCLKEKFKIQSTISSASGMHTRSHNLWNNLSHIHNLSRFIWISS